MLRATDAVLTDWSGIALDAAVSGRPVVSLAHDVDRVPLLLDLEHVLPGPVCRTADELMTALDTVWDGSAVHDERRRRLLAAPPDGRSAARVVAAVTG